MSAPQSDQKLLLALQLEAKKELKRFLIIILLLSIGWVLMGELIIRFGLAVTTPLFFYVVVLYSFILTYFIHRQLLKASNESPNTFVNMVMGLTGGKMFLSLGLLLIYGLLSEQEEVQIVLLTFVPVYFGNTGVEIYRLLTFMKTQKEIKNTFTEDDDTVDSKK